MKFRLLALLAATMALCPPLPAQAGAGEDTAVTTELTFVPTERPAWLEALPGGEDLFLMTDIGIRNPTDHAVKVPAIRIRLRDSGGALVYQVDLAPPAVELAPGQSLNVTQAIGPVPDTAARLEFGWQPVSPAD